MSEDKAKYHITMCEGVNKMPRYNNPPPPPSRRVESAALGINVGRLEAGVSAKKLTDLELNETVTEGNLIIRRVVGGWMYEYYSAYRLQDGREVRDVFEVVYVKE